MSRVCDLSGVRPTTGYNVSHSNVHTKRRFMPNLVNVSLHSQSLDQKFSLRIAAKTLRTVDKLGGLDAYLAQAKEKDLSAKALKIKRSIEKRAADA